MKTKIKSKPTILSAKNAAIVFKPDGKYELLLPRMKDTAKVPRHVLVAAGVLALLSDPKKLALNISVDQLVDAFTAGIKDG